MSLSNHELFRTFIPISQFGFRFIYLENVEHFNSFIIDQRNKIITIQNKILQELSIFHNF